MSRYYDMAVKVESVPEKIVAVVIEAVDEEWYSFTDNWSETEGENGTVDLFSCGAGNLSGGESEDEYSDRIRDAVWKASKMFVTIEVTATDLENAPSSDTSILKSSTWSGRNIRRTKMAIADPRLHIICGICGNNKELSWEFVPGDYSCPEDIQPTDVHIVCNNCASLTGLLDVMPMLEAADSKPKKVAEESFNHHQWFAHTDYSACSVCGIIRRADDKNKPCPGKIPLALRDGDKPKTTEEGIKDINQKFYGDHDFVQTSPCGRGQHHPHGIVGKLWRVFDPNTVRVGSCFMAGRLKQGDLYLALAHSGDCFQQYMYVEEFANGLKGRPDLTFGSYGIGDAVEVVISEEDFKVLESGEMVERDMRL